MAPKTQATSTTTKKQKPCHNERRGPGRRQAAGRSVLLYRNRYQPRTRPWRAKQPKLAEHRRVSHSPYTRLPFARAIHPKNAPNHPSSATAEMRKHRNLRYFAKSDPRRPPPKSRAHFRNTPYLRNPNYHQATDTPGTLDYPRMTEVTFGVASAMQRLLG